MVNFTCKFPFRVFVPSMGFRIAHFRYKRRFRQIWVKTTENFHLVVVSQIMMFPTVRFEYEKVLLAYFGEIHYI